MSDNSKTSGGGLGLASTLGVIFIVLKLIDVINWSWIWVLSPFWIGAIITLFFVIIISMLDSSGRW